MKKNISINISGIIFHIEEDAYETLKNYLDSVHKYFASYQDSVEIIADIESRIAEIFLSKLHENKQVITTDDVKSLIATMGNVHDFHAAESDYAESGGGQAQGSRNTFAASSQPRRLYRDQKRKILGGVCAGLGYYFNVDPVWIRLLFVLLTFAWGVILVAYIIMWIAIPGSYDLEESEVSKKLFRDPEKKVVGGVAAGLAAYFNTDVVLFRLLFVVFTIFGGLGLIAYIVLWIAVPQARTLTDRMQMQGEPVTLSNIESKLKKSPVGSDEESLLTRILLFPFRLIGWVITGLGRILNPVAHVLRVAAGIVLALAGLALLVAVFSLFGILLGMFTMHISWLPGWQDLSLPVQELARAIPSFTVFTGFVFLTIPGIVITLLGISVIAGRIIFNAIAGWTFFTLFLLSLVVLSLSVPKIVLSFREEGEIKTESVYNLNGKTPVIRTRDTGLDGYRAATLSLRGHAGNEIKLVQYFRAQGKSQSDAENYARQIVYNVQQDDSMLVFDSNIRFKEGSTFRAQRLRMTLYLPYNQPFVVEGDTWRLLSHYVPREDRYGQTWVVTEKNILKCLTCNERHGEVDDTVNWDEDSDVEGSVFRETGFDDFDEIELNGIYDVTIKQGNTYLVEFTGDDDLRDRYNVHQSGKTLVIEYENHFDWKRAIINPDKVHIRITLPDLHRLEANGAGKVTLSGISTDYLEVEVAGAVKLKGDVQARSLSAELTGASQLELSGECNTLEAELMGASNLDAYDFTVREARVSASGASKAKVYVTQKLEIEESVASDVDYRGNPRTVIKD